MGKWLTRILTIILLGVFLYSGGRLLAIRLRYYKSEKVYSDVADQVTTQVTAAKKPAKKTDSKAESDAAGAAATPEPEDSGLIKIPEDERAPVYVDFEALQAINKDVIGWIYCENTVINYPLVHVNNNTFYLDHNIKRESDPSGTIFSDESNHPGFVDSNIILYGHHMQNMSMFASLKYWLVQEYYEEHPVMWILTPDGDYRLDLFSGYETSAKSDSYTIYYGPSDAFDQHLQKVAGQSAFTPHPVTLDGLAHYVMLSTCAYSYDYARTVLHGKLTPVPSTGGYPNEGYK